MNQKGVIFLQESRSKMELESIRQYLNEKYKDQILRCSLFNVKPVDSAYQEWKLADRIAIFKESVESEFRVIVRAGGALLQVTMVFLGTNNSHSFNRLIVDRGLAEFVEIRKNNRKKGKRIPKEGCFQRYLFTIRNDPHQT